MSCCLTPAREMKFLGTLQRDAGAGTYGTLGEETANWTDEVSLYFKREDLRGRELELARQLYAKAQHRLTIRYRTGVTVTKRIKYRTQGQTRVLNIGHVDDFDPAKDITLLVSQDAATT